MRLAVLALAAAIASAATAQSSIKTRDYSFDYSYPAAVNAFPALRAWMNADSVRRRAQIARDAAADRVRAARDGVPFIPYQTEKTWKVVTDTPRFLSLSVGSYVFTGGAHGTPASGSIVWDKTAHRRLYPREVFASAAALQTALGPAWCRWVAAERVTRNGADADGGSFDKCPPIADLTILLGSSTGRAIDRIGLIADPYVAGSYAEGTYETTVPVTAAILRIVKPAYRGAFAIR